MDFREAQQQVASAEAGINIIDVARPDQIEVEPDALVTEGARLTLDEAGVTGLGRAVGIPPAYLATLEPAFRATVFRHHVAERGDLGFTPVRLFSREGLFVGVDRRNLVHLSGPEILDAIADGIGPKATEVEVHHADVGGLGFALDFVTPEVEREVVPGDVIQGGLHVEHSFIGDFATRIEPFVYRLVCQNGAVRRECPSRRGPRTRKLPVGHPEAKALQLEQVRRLANHALADLAPGLESIVKLKDEPIADPAALFTRWLQQARLSVRDLSGPLMAAWQQEGASPTGFGVYNALTRLGTHSADLTTRERRMLSRLAGVYAHRSVHVCERCFSVIAEAN